MASHVTRFPRPSPAVFYTESDEILEVGTAWERGYHVLCQPWYSEDDDCHSTIKADLLRAVKKILCRRYGILSTTAAYYYVSGNKGQCHMGKC